jgi:glyoxylase-like metal-dependent hydrolase (beta-lactamase superfamily II)
MSCRPRVRYIVHRISLQNSAFEGNNTAYLFDEGPDIVLIDPGDPTQTTREQLEVALANRGHTFADIDRILLSHWHPDHTGLAAAIQRASGARVHIHEADAPLVLDDETAWEAMRERQRNRFDEWGIPETKRDELLTCFDASPDRDPLNTVESFTDGRTFEVDGHELRAIHMPGHTAGLSGFVSEGTENRELFSGDALLPVYTPNVGGADVRVEQPLEQYLTTLKAIISGGFACAWPGHRHLIDDPRARAEHIIHHHEERAWRVLDTLAAHGPADPWTISDNLFGELEGIHILHGPGEAYAHLNHLKRTGDIVHTDAGYRVTESTIGQLTEITDERWPLI